VKTAQRLGMSLDEIREILAFRNRGESPCAYVRGVLDAQVAEIDQRLAELNRLREQLFAVQAQTEHLPTTETGCYCDIIEHAAPLASPPSTQTRRGPPGRTGQRH
jgi:DNA-binding transcriptional MerR regulator